MGCGEARAADLCNEIVTAVPIVELFPHVDDVHCLTSLAGFEALLRGLSVTCHGLPFYAGWGLTRDLHASPRRTRRLALDELVAGALILYPTYVSRTTGHFASPERALAELLPGAPQSGTEGRRRPAPAVAHSLPWQADLPDAEPVMAARGGPAKSELDDGRWPPNCGHAERRCGASARRGLTSQCSAAARAYAAVFSWSPSCSAFSFPLFWSRSSSPSSIRWLVSGAGFAIRGMGANGGTGLLGAVAGLANSGTTTSNAYIVLKYMKRRGLVEKVDRDVSLRKVYAREDVTCSRG